MNDVPLREYVERIFNERERAIEMAAAALKARLDTMEQADFVRRSQLDALLEELRREIAAIKENQAASAGRMWAVGIGSVILAGLVTLALRLVGH